MPAEEPLTSLGRLVGEASRQLTICNSCRYCEGLCAVYPALERRNLLDAGDVSQLANLCHDCRACYSACMYTDPHEFALNIPAVLASVRLRDYRRYVWPSREPRLATGWLGVFSGSVAATLVVLAVLPGRRGAPVLGGDGGGQVQADRPLPGTGSAVRAGTALPARRRQRLPLPRRRGTVAEMTVKDYGLLVALTFLGLSGLAVLLVRETPAFGIVLLVHLASVMLSFASAPTASSAT
jgi:hypothetical protein